MDVVPEGGSKSVGIDAICRSYGIAPDETMAFGDGQNDIEMLRHAGIGVAMSNAAEEVQAAARLRDRRASTRMEWAGRSGISD